MKEKSYEQTLYDVVHENKIDELQAGHAEEAPRYLKNILARLRELPLHDREVWLKAIMAKFEQDFSHAKWREGYEQGKFEASLEINKKRPVVKQFVADWIDVCKEKLAVGLYIALNPDFVKQYSKSNELIAWVRKYKNQEVFARAWIFGYEVEKEKRYLVKMKNILDGDSFLNLSNTIEIWFWGDKKDTEYVRTYHTRKELEEAGFGWVFDCEGVEVEEVEDE